jgi:hypothetical protein
MQITYQDVKEFIETLTPEQRALPARVYAGDIDDAIPVSGTAFNTPRDMGESLAGYPEIQPFMLI